MRPIDADDAIHQIDMGKDDYNIAFLEETDSYTSGAFDAIDHDISVLEAAHTLDVMPVKRGRWVKMTGMMPPEYHGHYECSECQWHMKGLRNSWTREEELSYCPHCGAKMDGEVVSE